MKTINTYINERLHVTTKSFYSCQPKTKEELREIIIQRIRKEGTECDLNDIDVSNITDMSWLFDSNKRYNGHKIFKNFNGDISQWNVSKVVNMDHMFSDCKEFNGDLSRWNVSNVKNMFAMFNKCANFNGGLSRWDVSNVENMRGMFYECENFNCDLSHWDVSNVEDMNQMFVKCTKFNCNISRWDVSNVKDITFMFFECKNFNCDLSQWNVSNLKNGDMWRTFYKCPTQPKWYDKDECE